MLREKRDISGKGSRRELVGKKENEGEGLKKGDCVKEIWERRSLKGQSESVGIDECVFIADVVRRIE